ncbi:hypothetical protein LA080_011309 [Diaporthe eres]|uniref:Uncharacterized protein n=1 Tax=Diaporthe vaccinii TaxID=105482 RepID=A0ABR4EDX9_9PEZI|nr:hypothetical protein LA080_011309 [Diaporthe eres]
MQSTQMFMTAILVAILSLVGASPTINGSIIASTLTLNGATVTINDSIITSTLTVIGASTSISDSIITSTLSVVGPSAAIDDNLIASALNLTDGGASTTASTTTSTTASTSASIILNPTPFSNPNNTSGCNPCYCEGETWDDLGTWGATSWALQNSGIVRVTYIPGGYHVNENIRVGDHCFVLEIGVDTGNSGGMTPSSITDLVSAAHNACSHGGLWPLNFVAWDGDIIGRGWLKADPQGNSDCS